MAKKRAKLANRLHLRIHQETGGKCAFCPVAEVASLEIHHIDGNPSNKRPENLIRVCASCHGKISGGILTEEQVIQKKRQLMLIIHSALYGDPEADNNDFVDVTNAVQEMFLKGKKKFRVTNSLLQGGPDPAEFIAKTLTVNYSLCGIRTLKSATEGDFFEFS